MKKMPLPYSIIKSYKVDVSLEKFFLKLKTLEQNKKFKNINFDNNIIECELENNFLTGCNKIEIRQNTDYTGVKYELFLNNILKFNIVLITVFVFLFKDILHLVLYSAIAIIIVYFIAIIHYINKIEEIFDKLFVEKEEPEEIGLEQQNWLENFKICPACGIEITEYHSICPECGINISKIQKVKKAPSSRTDFFDKQIKYNFKENNLSK